LLAYTTFLRLVREWGASRAGSYAFVSPVIAVLLGVLVFNETVTSMDVLGMAVMLAGAWLALRPVEQDLAVSQRPIRQHVAE
jgi:drug/metabolite transporter (DMT)-like permease